MKNSYFFGQNLRFHRERAGLSLEALAERLSVSVAELSSWEEESVSPSVEELFSLASALGKTPSEMLEELPSPRRHTDGMESLRELYKVGSGPSSSHTIGPEVACSRFLDRNLTADSFKVILYGSLAKTGSGHGTDRIIKKVFGIIPCEIVFDENTPTPLHPNTMDLFAIEKGEVISSARVYSVGGGTVLFEGEPEESKPLIYKLHTFNDIAALCKERDLHIWQYAYEVEGPDFADYIQLIWEKMKASIAAGLNDDGILPGGLSVQKKAKYLYSHKEENESLLTRQNRLLAAYAFAVSEQNACGGKIVTAPTCGAAGVLPAVLYYLQEEYGFSDHDICRALTVGGIIGNLVKTNASISGAECGCQAEVGTACAMAAAAVAELHKLSLSQIEYAAEVAIEHHLGLTCDPICGLVQIPCIERNAVAAMRALNATNLATFLSETRKISFDDVVKAMLETGRDLDREYRETSEGGLAKLSI